MGRSTDLQGGNTGDLSPFFGRAPGIPFRGEVFGRPRPHKGYLGCGSRRWSALSRFRTLMTCAANHLSPAGAEIPRRTRGPAVFPSRKLAPPLPLSWTTKWAPWRHGMIER